MPLKLYVGRKESPQLDTEWEFQADFADFNDATIHAREIAKRSRLPTIICEEGWFNLGGHRTRTQEILCWWSDNYEAEMGLPSPLEPGLGYYPKYDEIHPYLTHAPAAASIQPPAILPPNPRQASSFREPEWWSNRKPERPKTALSRLMWLIFMMPGECILWFEYYFPARGQVYGTGRRYGNKTVTVMTTLAFYASLGILFGIAVLIGRDYHGE